MNLELVNLLLSKTLVTGAGGICCCAEQCIGVSPKYFKVILSMDDPQIDILTLPDKVHKSSSREPRLLNFLGKELL